MSDFGFGPPIPRRKAEVFSDPELEAAFGNVLQANPRLRNRSFAVQRGNGPGQLEFFPPGEAFNPNPGRPTIEVRNPDLQGEFLERALLGDALHFLGGVDDTGRPNDAAFRALKNDFVNALQPREIEFARRRFEQERQPQDRRSFEEWFDQVWADALIRGLIAPDERAEFVESRDQFMTPRAEGVLRDMIRFLQSGEEQ